MTEKELDFLNTVGSIVLSNETTSALFKYRYIQEAVEEDINRLSVSEIDKAHHEIVKNCHTMALTLHFVEPTRDLNLTNHNGTRQLKIEKGNSFFLAVTKELSNELRLKPLKN